MTQPDPSQDSTPRNGDSGPDADRAQGPGERRAPLGGPSVGRALLRHWGADLKIAATRLTSLPFAGAAGESALPPSPDLAVRAYPIVGLGIGLAGGIAYALAATLFLPPLLSALIAVAAMAALTSAQLETGFAAIVERMAREREANAAVGAMAVPGTLALILSIALKAGALAAIESPEVVILTLMGVAAASRATGPMVARWLAHREGYAAAGDDAATTTGALLGGLLAILCLGSIAGIVALGLGALATARFATLTHRHHTTDANAVETAAEHVIETVMLIAAAIVR